MVVFPRNLYFIHGALIAAWAIVAGCGTERPAPCVANSCGTLTDRDVITVFPDLAEASVTDAPADHGAPMDRTVPDAGAPMDIPAADIPQDVADDIPRDPPITTSRTDLGTRGLIASLPCSDVLRHLSVQVTPRTVPPNSFQLRVTNASPTETLSVWYDATLISDWNIESLSPQLMPGASVTLDFWRSEGSPAWYVLGINRRDHYTVNGSGVFIELPCGRAARNATQTFRATIPP